MYAIRSYYGAAEHQRADEVAGGEREQHAAQADDAAGYGILQELV